MKDFNRHARMLYVYTLLTSLYPLPPPPSIIHHHQSEPYPRSWAPHHLGYWPRADLPYQNQEDMPLEEVSVLLLVGDTTSSAAVCG